MKQNKSKEKRTLLELAKEQNSNIRSFKQMANKITVKNKMDFATLDNSDRISQCLSSNSRISHAISNNGKKKEVSSRLKNYNDSNIKEEEYLKVK